jgi:hypothetical protein
MRLFRRREPSDLIRGLPRLTDVPLMAELPKARLQSPARYLGTVTEEDEPVVGQSLSVKSSSRLHLSNEALDVVRIAGSFRIPAEGLRGATTATHFGGKPVRDLLVIRWEHGEQEWRTGFRMEPSKNIKSGASAPDLDQWVRTISKMARKTPGGK